MRAAVETLAEEGTAGPEAPRLSIRGALKGLRFRGLYRLLRDILQI